MPKYLIQESYTHQGLCGLVSSPEDRSGVIKDLVESVGGQIITFDYCFGGYDFWACSSLPTTLPRQVSWWSLPAQVQ